MTPISLPDEPEPAIENTDIPDERTPAELETPVSKDLEDPDGSLDESGESELPGEEIFDLPEDLKEEIQTSPSSEEPLLDLEMAIEKVPASLRKEMEDLLRAEFREVVRWKEPK